ncbi:4Fe-4S dicluster domain-containing protein [bacterium]|nr:4Fe-4S dicluster domain-containing protein [candidate division CSSED10-310 bacterium]
MLSVVEILVFVALLGLTVYGFSRPLVMRYRLVRLGRNENRFDSRWRRIVDPVTSFFFLRCSVKKERIATGLIHFFILYGSLTFDMVSITHILEGFKANFIPFGHGLTGHIWSLWVDIFAVMVLLAVLYFVIRRYIFRPDSYTYTTLDSAYIYLFLTTVTATFLLYEGGLIALHPGHARWSFAGTAVADWTRVILTTTPAMELNVRIHWWLHIVNVFLFVAYVPHSKYIHMITGPINIAFRNRNPVNSVKPLDIESEEAEVFGVEKLTDFTWKDLLDGFACMDCGRCQDYCPAYRTEKALSPKNIIIHMRETLLAQGQEHFLKPDNGFKPLMAGTYSGSEIWSCTTCGACVQVCPVKNEQFPKIVQLRQSQVLMEGTFPTELKRVFKGLETNANPWGVGAATRMDWARDLDIPRFADHPDVEYLLFLGCAASFDDRAQRVSRALIRFLKSAGVSFGILGEKESCCGETARRLGEEAVGQTLIQTNIELFNELGVKKILTACPHGYNTFKNEYPKFGARYEVLHHSQLIQSLFQQHRIRVDAGASMRVAVHDSCYLGRANNLYEPPRDALRGVPGIRLVEPAETREHSFCCGGGGGMFWLEEEGRRINAERWKQLVDLKPDAVATACPFCLRMLEDASKDAGQDGIAVRDIVEFLVSVPAPAGTAD